jgi:hypothetical protein
MTHGRSLKNHSLSWGSEAKNSSTKASGSRRFPLSKRALARKTSAVCSDCGSAISRASSSARWEYSFAPDTSPWAASAELDAIRTVATR